VRAMLRGEGRGSRARFQNLGSRLHVPIAGGTAPERTLRWTPLSRQFLVPANGECCDKNAGAASSGANAASGMSVTLPYLSIGFCQT